MVNSAVEAGRDPGSFGVTTPSAGGAPAPSPSISAWHPPCAPARCRRLTGAPVGAGSARSRGHTWHGRRRCRAGLVESCDRGAAHDPVWGVGHLHIPTPGWGGRRGDGGFGGADHGPARRPLPDPRRSPRQATTTTAARVKPPVCGPAGGAALIGPPRLAKVAAVDMAVLFGRFGGAVDGRRGPVVVRSVAPRAGCSRPTWSPGRVPTGRLAEPIVASMFSPSKSVSVLAGFVRATSRCVGSSSRPTR